MPLIKPPRAAELNNLVSIYHDIESADSAGYGEAIPTSRLFSKVWAKIETQGGREFFRASQIYPTMTHLVTIRFLKNVTPKMKIVFESRTLNIEAVLNVDQNNVMLRMPCTEAA